MLEYTRKNEIERFKFPISENLAPGPMLHPYGQNWSWTHCQKWKGYKDIPEETLVLPPIEDNLMHIPDHFKSYWTFVRRNRFTGKHVIRLKSTTWSVWIEMATERSKVHAYVSSFTSLKNAELSILTLKDTRAILLTSAFSHLEM